MPQRLQHQTVVESEMDIGDETNEEIRHCSRTQADEQNEALTDDSVLDLEGNGDRTDYRTEDYEESLPTALTGSTGLKAHNQLKADATPKQTVEQEFIA